MSCYGKPFDSYCVHHWGGLGCLSLLSTVGLSLGFYCFYSDLLYNKQSPTFLFYFELVAFPYSTLNVSFLWYMVSQYLREVFEIPPMPFSKWKQMALLESSLQYSVTFNHGEKHGSRMFENVLSKQSIFCPNQWHVK